MQLTYDEALAVIDHTEIGYTIASQDKLWTVFIFDDDPDSDYRFNQLWPCGPRRWAYDMDIGALMWTSRTEAEAYAAALRETVDTDVYVMNFGDNARWEDLLLGGYRRTRETPKFKGSQRAWDALTEMTQRWREVNQ